MTSLKIILILTIILLIVSVYIAVKYFYKYKTVNLAYYYSDNKNQKLEKSVNSLTLELNHIEAAQQTLVQLLYTVLDNPVLETKHTETGNFYIKRAFEHKVDKDPISRIRLTLEDGKQVRKTISGKYAYLVQDDENSEVYITKDSIFSVIENFNPKAPYSLYNALEREMKTLVKVKQDT